VHCGGAHSSVEVKPLDWNAELRGRRRRGGGPLAERVAITLSSCRGCMGCVCSRHNLTEGPSLCSTVRARKCRPSENIRAGDLGASARHDPSTPPSLRRAGCVDGVVLAGGLGILQTPFIFRIHELGRPVSAPPECSHGPTVRVPTWASTGSPSCSRL
jgi:hypothetical protein